MTPLQFPEIVEGFQKAGVQAGDTVLIHSALRPFGYVEGGAATVAKALYSALGEMDGTLVAPAFCFVHEIQDNPIIDPENDESEMGAISEAVRHMQGALRSLAYRHSFSALGRHAQTVTDVDPFLPVFDMRSTFGKLLALDAKVILAGVTYINSTTHHFGEYLLQVPERHTLVRQVRLRRPDGSLQQMEMTDYQPRPTKSGDYYEVPHDFNKLGLWLEQAGKVRVSAIGNAVIRTFRMRDLVDLMLHTYPLDQRIFFEDEAPVALPDGAVAQRDYIDGAGREDTAIWSCLKPGEVLFREKQ